MKVVNQSQVPLPHDAERGSGPVTVVLFLGILAVVFAIGVTAVGGVANKETSAAQAAADAAALAGARSILDRAPSDLAPGFRFPTEIPVLLGGSACSARGHAEAQRLAQTNGANVTDYCWNPFTDRISVTVTLPATEVSGDVVSASAVAQTRFAPGSCTVDPGFDIPTPSPTPSAEPPSPSPGPTSTPEPPPILDTDIECGGFSYPITWDMSLNRFVFLDPPLATLLDDLDPRLVA
ncbi:pilus assembly protein TadG-related protein [Naumannella halotolerans]|uniref:Putative Flp pilus-assembly TadE/G-like protein n=1 Tax=Naumannella halotolerans TaxID=993414 RepID=A0A4R7J2H3_9ACTN|nr:pilus assembly protein TadG-related protein [Naumannella halotolerans]TDT31284.1 putative Flp pilus-assembly TadE/G-like protein [Naumannella halotolerans]